MVEMIERIVNEVKREKRNQITESRRRTNRRYNSKLNEQATTVADVIDLGVILNTSLLNRGDGVYELKPELANVNILSSVGDRMDTETISDKSPEFSGAYARPLYVSKNKNMFFIGKSMSGGPIGQGKSWSTNPQYKIAEPVINDKGLVRKGYREEVLNTNSAKAAYMQIYNFNTEGYRNNKEITKLVQLLESKGIIPNLKDEIADSAYNLFTQNRHDGAIRTIKTA
jgi:hypothetical protein